MLSASRAMADGSAGSSGCVMVMLAGVAKEGTSTAGSSGSRNGWLICTGPGCGQLACSTTRVASRCSHAGSKSGCGAPSGCAAADMAAEQADLVDRLVGAAVALQLRRSVGGNQDQRHAGLAGFDRGWRPDWPAPSRKWRAGRPGGGSPWRCRARKTLRCAGRPQPRSSPTAGWRRMARRQRCVQTGTGGNHRMSHPGGGKAGDQRLRPEKIERAGVESCVAI